MKKSIIIIFSVIFLILLIFLVSTKIFPNTGKVISGFASSNEGGSGPSIPKKILCPEEQEYDSKKIYSCERARDSSCEPENGGTDLSQTHYCPDEREKCCIVDKCPKGWIENGKTCCNPQTHVACGGEICCPKANGDNNLADDNGQYCGSKMGYYFCKVTEDQCGEEKDENGNSYKKCSGKFPAGDKSICCPQDSTCGFGPNNVPSCVYDSCPPETFECGGAKTGGGIMCCKKGSEVCEKFYKDQYSCISNENSCDKTKGEEPCKGIGDWSNVVCCPPQFCTHDASGYARCQN